MLIKLDENLPTELKIVLRQLGHDVDTVPEEGLGGLDDPRIWLAGRRRTQQQPLATQT